jgi:hypothetical protein
MKTPLQGHIRQTLFGTLVAVANLAHAGVIQGTGAAPSATQLGATDAVAFKVAESGQGHMLLVPYFTAQRGQMSVLHLVNTDTANGKAVKLRYRGAGNADILLDFTVLLSSADVWTGAVHVGNDGRAHIITADRSCTYPPIQPHQLQPFSTDRLNQRWSAAELANNTREGYVEAIVMADISSNDQSALYRAISPAGPLTPPQCTESALEAALLTDTSVEAVAASHGLATPTGTLMGSWYIIDVPNSTTFSDTATAFMAVNSSGQPARGNYVLFPQSRGAVAQPEHFTTDPLLVPLGRAGTMSAQGTQMAVLQARFSDLPDLSTPYYLPASVENARRTVSDLAQTLAAKSMRNQYALDPSISAKTDFVLSMPTKRYSVAYDYLAQVSVYSPNSPTYFHGSTQILDVSRGQLLTDLGWAATNAYGRSGYDGPVEIAMVPNPPPPTMKLPGTVAVVSFRNAGSASSLGSSLTNERFDIGMLTHGWFNIDLAKSNGLGLPVLGASFIKLTNPAAQPGVSGNYGITWPHSYTR